MNPRRIVIVVAITGAATLAGAATSSAAPRYEPCPGDEFQCAGIVVVNQPSYGVANGLGGEKPDLCNRYEDLC